MNSTSVSTSCATDRCTSSGSAFHRSGDWPPAARSQLVAAGLRARRPRSRSSAPALRDDLRRACVASARQASPSSCAFVFFVRLRAFHDHGSAKAYGGNGPDDDHPDAGVARGALQRRRGTARPSRAGRGDRSTRRRDGSRRAPPVTHRRTAARSGVERGHRLLALPRAQVLTCRTICSIRRQRGSPCVVTADAIVICARWRTARRLRRSDAVAGADHRPQLLDVARRVPKRAGSSAGVRRHSMDIVSTVAAQVSIGRLGVARTRPTMASSRPRWIACSGSPAIPRHVRRA